MNIKKTLATIGIIIGLGLICFLGIQAVIYGIGHSMDADSVECDWWQCSFKKTLKEVEMNCYHNGEQVPCTEIDIYDRQIEDAKRQAEP